MKTFKYAVAMFGLTMVSAACQKGSMEVASNSEAVQAVSCKTQTAPVDPADLKIEGSTVAQAGRTASYKLNYDLRCSGSQKVVWETSDGKILAQSGAGMISSFSAAGQYTVSAKIENGSGSQFAAKGSAEIVQKTTVVGTEPTLIGPQVGIVGQAQVFDLGIPESYALASASWEFGDGSNAVSGMGPLSHTYSLPGLFNIRVTLEDASGASTVLTRQLNVIDVFDGTECVVDTSISSPAQGNVGTPVPFSVYLPSCLAPHVTSITWDFGDSTNGTGRTTSHTYGSVGDYTVTVRIYAPYAPPGTPFLTLTQTIHINPALPAPTPTPSASPTPPPNPLACDTAGGLRESTSAPATQTLACGLDGSKRQTWQTRTIEECRVMNGDLVWTEISRTPVMISETACEGQSCTLPDGSKIGNGTSRVLYSTSQANGLCSDVSQTRTCSNGTLSGSSNYSVISCRSGCGDFGKDGTVKNGTITGEIQVPLVCQFGEEGFSSTYNQLADQRCDDGKILSSNSRQGDVKSAGQCPTYAWTASDNWTQCTSDCGGKQTRMFECRNDKGASAPADRCSGAAPTQERVCDGNPAAVARTERAMSQEEAGSTQVCPKNQIGVVLNHRDVTTIKSYACIDHAVQLANETKEYGAWVTTSYCRDYVAHRCSQDSLSNTEAKGRYQWMLKCQDSVPQIKEFLTQFADVEVSGGYTISSTSRPLYATFMNRATNPAKAWIAPKKADGSCEVPGTTYVAAVCLASCATPDMEILAQAEAKAALKYVPFIDALTQNHKFVATLQSNSSMSSKTVVKTRVEQWVTEMIDTDHDIIEFRLKSGRVLKLTPNHPVVTAEGTMKLASNFKVGESLVMLGGKLDAIVSANHVQYTGKVYNLFVKSNAIHHNVVVTNGYLNGTAYFQNEGAKDLNRVILRNDLLRGAFKK